MDSQKPVKRDQNIVVGGPDPIQDIEVHVEDEGLQDIAAELRGLEASSFEENTTDTVEPVASDQAAGDEQAVESTLSVFVNVESESTPSALVDTVPPEIMMPAVEFGPVVDAEQPDINAAEEEIPTDTEPVLGVHSESQVQSDIVTPDLSAPAHNTSIEQEYSSVEELVDAFAEPVVAKPETPEQDVVETIAVSVEPGVDDQNSIVASSMPESESGFTPESDPTQNSPKTMDIIAPTTVAAAAAAGVVNAITGETEQITNIKPTDQQTAQLEPAQSKPTPKPITLFVVVGVVVGLFIAAAVTLFIFKPGSKKAEMVTPSPLASSAITGLVAEQLTDFSRVCSGTVVSNAAPYQGAGTHPVVLFQKQADGINQYEATFKDVTWQASAVKLETTQLVGCIERSDSFAGTKIKVCPLSNANKVVVDVDYFTAQYTVSLFEAQSGKKVSTETIASNTSICPPTANFTVPDPKVFAAVDTDTLEQSIIKAFTSPVN